MSKNIEDEIQAALHAQPATGSLDPRLDFFIKQAEIFIEDARQTILGKMPDGDLPEHKAVAYESMMQTISGASWNCQLQTASIDQSIQLTAEKGVEMFKAIASRPANTTEEQLGRRWDSFKALLDSMGPAMSVVRIKDELARAVSPGAGGDALDLFILRNGESLLYRYLESRQAPLEAYFRAVKETALEYETSVVEAVDTVLFANRLADTWPGIKDKLSKQLISLNSLAEKQALSWEKSSGISVQSDASGAVNVRFDNMDAFRQWCKTPRGV